MFQTNIKSLTNRQNCFKKGNVIDKCVYEGNETNKLKKNK